MLDLRHQDATLLKVKEIILGDNLSNKEELVVESEELFKPKNRRESKTTREKEKKRAIEVQKDKFFISLSGDAILAGKTLDWVVNTACIYISIGQMSFPHVDLLPFVSCRPAWFDKHWH